MFSCSGCFVGGLIMLAIQCMCYCIIIKLSGKHPDTFEFSRVNNVADDMHMNNTFGLDILMAL